MIHARAAGVSGTEYDARGLPRNHGVEAVLSRCPCRARKARSSDRPDARIAVLPIALQTPFMQPPPRLESLVLRSGVHLGPLPESDRALVLALGASAIVRRPASGLAPGRTVRKLIP